MKLSFTCKLAWQNIRSNKQIYLPFILSSMLTVAMFFMIASLIENPITQERPNSLLFLFQMGTVVVSIFSLIFIFYANSFLMKRRKKEIGLYNVLGLEKRHIAWVLFVETLITSFTILLGGVIIGNVFGQLNFWVLNYLLELPQEFNYTAALSTFTTTILVFGGIFLVTYLYNLTKIQFSRPIELLKGSNEGEKEPKSSPILFIIGLIVLGVGYFISVSIDDPLNAFLMFFVAVFCVIVGTYLLFNAGSIIVLKALKKRKSFYYKPGPFISISGMLYRMKQHATGLANICILSVMVIVSVSTTAALYVTAETTIRNAFPEDNVLSISDSTGQVEADMEWIVEQYQEDVIEETQEYGLAINELVTYRVAELYGRIQEGEFIRYDYEATSEGGDQPSDVTFMPVEDYTHLTSEEMELMADNEVYIYSDSRQDFPNEITIGDNIFDVERIEEVPEYLEYGSVFTEKLVFVFSDIEIMRGIINEINVDAAYDEWISHEIIWTTSGTTEEIREYGDHFSQYMEERDHPASYPYYGNIEVDRVDYMDLIGGFLFLGVYLGLLFTIGAALITYFKQVSEGYDDRMKIQAMQKVGLDKRTTRKATHSQVIWMFLLPLITAVIHTSFAYPLLYQLINLLGRMNHMILLVSIGLVVTGFATIYAVIYHITSKVYLNIVE